MWQACHLSAGGKLVSLASNWKQVICNFCNGLETEIVSPQVCLHSKQCSGRKSSWCMWRDESGTSNTHRDLFGPRALISVDLWSAAERRRGLKWRGQAESGSLAQLLLVGMRNSSIERDMSWCWSNEIPVWLVWVRLFGNNGLGKAPT